MFRVGPVMDADAQWPDHGPVGVQQRPDDPFAGLDPHNPSHPSSVMGKAVLRRNNQLCKMFIERMRLPISQFTVPEQRIRRAEHWLDLPYDQVDTALDFA
eukprot:5343335-Amphidinium_carterae.1